jgi:hypothetical protein
VAASAGVVASGAFAQDVARLPPVVTAPAPGPPLATSTTLREIRFRGRISSNERVLVEVGPGGAPTAIAVQQRLALSAKGDYFMGVQAPVVSVRRAPGSDAEPGGRRGLILWQGFSPGRRVLAADARLSVGAAASFLPLRISVEQRGDRVVVTIRNATRTTVAGFSGSIAAPEAANVLDGLRDALREGRPAGERYVTVEGLKPTGSFAVEVPMRVAGEVRLAKRRMRIATVVRTARPFVARLDGPETPVFALRATPVAPFSLVRPPEAPTWAAAVKAGRVRAGHALLRHVQAARLAAARHRQYEQFLANPDQLGAARTVYVFRSAPKPRVAAAPREDGDGRALAVVLGIVAAALAGGLLTVWWAHS